MQDKAPEAPRAHACVPSSGITWAPIDTPLQHSPKIGITSQLIVLILWNDGQHGPCSHRSEKFLGSISVSRYTSPVILQDQQGGQRVTWLSPNGADQLHRDASWPSWSTHLAKSISSISGIGLGIAQKKYVAQYLNWWVCDEGDCSVS